MKNNFRKILEENLGKNLNEVEYNTYDKYFRDKYNYGKDHVAEKDSATLNKEKALKLKKQFQEYENDMGKLKSKLRPDIDKYNRIADELDEVRDGDLNKLNLPALPTDPAQAAVVQASNERRVQLAKQKERRLRDQLEMIRDKIKKAISRYNDLYITDSDFRKYLSDNDAYVGVYDFVPQVDMTLAEEVDVLFEEMLNEIREETSLLEADISAGNINQLVKNRIRAEEILAKKREEGTATQSDAALANKLAQQQTLVQSEFIQQENEKKKKLNDGIVKFKESVICEALYQYDIYKKIRSLSEEQFSKFLENIDMDILEDVEVVCSEAYEIAISEFENTLNEEVVDTDDLFTEFVIGGLVGLVLNEASIPSIVANAGIGGALKGSVKKTAGAAIGGAIDKAITGVSAGATAVKGALTSLPVWANHAIGTGAGVLAAIAARQLIRANQVGKARNKYAREYAKRDGVKDQKSVDAYSAGRNWLGGIRHVGAEVEKAKVEAAQKGITGAERRHMIGMAKARAKREFKQGKEEVLQSLRDAGLNPRDYRNISRHAKVLANNRLAAEASKKDEKKPETIKEDVTSIENGLNQTNKRLEAAKKQAEKNSENLKKKIQDQEEQDQEKIERIENQKDYLERQKDVVTNTSGTSSKTDSEVAQTLEEKDLRLEMMGGKTAKDKLDDATTSKDLLKDPSVNASLNRNREHALAKYDSMLFNGESGEALRFLINGEVTNKNSSEIEVVKTIKNNPEVIVIVKKLNSYIKKAAAGKLTDEMYTDMKVQKFEFKKIFTRAKHEYENRFKIKGE